MEKPLFAALGWIAFLSLAVYLGFSGRMLDDGVGEASAFADAESEGTLGSEVRRLRRQLAKSELRAAELERKAAEQRAHIARLEAYTGDIAVPLGGDAWTSGIDWRPLAESLASDADLLGQARGALDPESRARLVRLDAVVKELGEAARRLTDHPLLDRGVFRELTDAIVEQPLELGDAALAAVHERIDAVFEARDADPASMRPLERHALRIRLLRTLWEAAGDAVPRGREERWRAVRGWTTFLLREGSITELGVDRESVADDVLAFVRDPYGLDDAQIDAVRETIPDYVEDVRDVLALFGQSRDEIRRLDDRAGLELDERLLDAQDAFERRIVPVLRAEQLAELRLSSPSLLRFTFGSGRSSYAVDRVF